jgi:hypothetical protein
VHLSPSPPRRKAWPHGKDQFLGKKLEKNVFLTF